MKYGNIPGVDKRISRVAQGAIMLNSETETEGFALLDASYAHGCTTFDTAHVYGDGECDRVLGRWIAARGQRDKIVVIGKGAHHNADRKRVTPFDITADIYDTLARMRTDYIDLYRLYSVDDDRMNLMTKAKQAGKIRAVGVVSHDEPTMVRYIDQYGSSLDFVMIVYNFHNNKGNPKVRNYPYNDYSALIPRCEKMKLGILGIKPMGSDAMIALAKEEGFFRNRSANVAQAMLRHIYASPEIDCTMPAMNGMDEVVTNLESAYKPALSEDERSLLAKLSGSAARVKEAYLPDHYKWLENWRVKTV